MDKTSTLSLSQRITGALCVAIAAILWLLFQIRLWNSGNAFFYDNAQPFIDLFGKGRIEMLNNITLTRYLPTFPPVLLAYGCLALLPRQYPFSGSNTKKYWCLAALIAAIPIFYAVLFQLTSGYVILGIVAAELLGILFAVYLPSLLRNRKQLFSRRSIAKGAARYGMCLVIVALMSFIYGMALGILNAVEKNAASGIIHQFSVSNTTVGGVVILAIAAPLVEEPAFRGLIFGMSKKFVPVWAAAIFSAVIFGIWHRNLPQFLGTLPMGVIMAFVYHQTGRLRYAMVCHSLSNLILVLAIVQRGVLPYIPFLHQLQETIVNRLPLPALVVFLTLAAAGIVGILWKLMPLAAERSGE